MSQSLWSRPRWFAVPALLLVLAGCGYSEEEMQKKNNEISDLQSRLTAEQAASKKSRDELDAARKEVDELKGDLKARGIDISNLNANLEQQARALEDYKRRAAQLEAITRRFELLRQKLQGLTKLGLNVTVRQNRMTIQLPGDVLFDSGRETLKKEGQAILLKVAEIIRNDPGLASRTFQVAGHTDNAPLSGGRFKDNWGLSVMRAREVLVFLVTPPEKGGGLNPTHWSAAGFGDTDPVKPNDTPEGMQANRRCELVVVPSAEEILDLKSLTQ
ncbi:MAG TPA: OmpA family protein [Minicystis sp.]|nr:OmpA family protein [Minicystis sp.]